MYEVEISSPTSRDLFGTSTKYLTKRVVPFLFYYNSLKAKKISNLNVDNRCISLQNTQHIAAKAAVFLSWMIKKNL
jgi:hypothetical protein